MRQVGNAAVDQVMLGKDGRLGKQSSAKHLQQHLPEVAIVTRPLLLRVGASNVGPIRSERGMWKLPRVGDKRVSREVQKIECNTNAISRVSSRAARQSQIEEQFKPRSSSSLATVQEQQEKAQVRDIGKYNAYINVFP